MPIGKYQFIDKDPIVDVIRTLYLDSPMGAHEVCAKARICYSTFDNILYGKTKRPQHFTIFKLFQAFGVTTRYYIDGAELSVRRNTEAATVRRRKQERRAPVRETSVSPKRGAKGPSNVVDLQSTSRALKAIREML